MDVSKDVPAAAGSATFAASLSRAARQIELADKIAILCVFLGWFLLNTLVVTLGSLQHGVRFYDISAAIADPSRLFFGLHGSAHRILFGLLCVACLLAPVLPHFRRGRFLWIAYVVPLVLMATSGIWLYVRASGEFIAVPSGAIQTGENLVQLANDLVHHGSTLVARHVAIGAGGYLAAIASVVLGLRGSRHLWSLLR